MPRKTQNDHSFQNDWTPKLQQPRRKPQRRITDVNKAARYILFGFLIYFGIALVGYLSRTQMETEMKQYCQMHKLFLETNGELGWPDYNQGLYAKQCTAGGKVRPELLAR